MVAILVPQPDDAAAGATPARHRRPTTSRPRPRAVPGAGGHHSPGSRGSAPVVSLRAGTARALPDHATRVRRRRLAALLLAMAVAAALVVGTQAALAAGRGVSPSSPEPAPPPGAPAAGDTYVVRPGDTLWSIAAAIAPESDPRPIVHALRDANGGPQLDVGQRLRVSID